MSHYGKIRVISNSVNREWKLWIYEKIFAINDDCKFNR